MYKLVEEFTRSKWKDNFIDLNEDNYVDTPFYAVVADGATCEKNIKIDNKSPGKTASSLVVSYFNLLKKDLSFDEALEELENLFKNWYKEHESVYKGRITTCLVALNKKRGELWFIGDCQALVDGKLYSYPKDIDDLTALLRAYNISCMLERKEVSVDQLLKKDTSREQIVKIIENQIMFQNSTKNNRFCYGTLDGYPTLRKDCHVVKLEKDVKNIVLTSDGYPYLCETFEKTEKKLSTLLKKDPLLIKDFICAKGLSKDKVSFDDRTYLRLENK